MKFESYHLIQPLDADDNQLKCDHMAPTNADLKNVRSPTRAERFKQLNVTVVIIIWLGEMWD